MDIASIVALLSSVPYVGKALVLILSFIGPVVMLATSLVAALHVAVQMLQALAKFPAFAKLQVAADALKKNDEAVSGFWDTKAKPILDRLSALPMPKV